MIPLKLHIKNFLSYGSELQTIDFGSYPLICLSGKNGHGKSALLDAITWAIWGQARKISGVAKADDNLLHLGQTQMMVSLDCLCNGVHYRIRREYAKTYGKPVGSLDFGIIEDNNRIVSLTDKTIRRTQEKIEQVFRLSYEAFINSAFLRQGQANEFSKKSPKDRKEILAAILSLTEYEEVKKLATERAKEAASEKMGLTAFLEKLTTDLSLTDEVALKLQTTVAQLEQLASSQKNFETLAQELIIEQQRIDQQKNELNLLLYKQENLLAQERTQQEALKKEVSLWKAVHKKQLLQQDPATLESEKKRLTEKIKLHQLTLQKSLELKEHVLQLQEKKQKLAHTLDTAHQQQLQKITLAYERELSQARVTEQKGQELQKQYANKLKELNEATGLITKQELHLYELSVDETELKRLEKQFEKRKEYYSQYAAQGNVTKQQLTDLDSKQHLSNDESNPSCPLCEQNLTASRRRFLKTKFVEQQQFLQHRFNRYAHLVTSLKKTLIEQHNEISMLKKKKDEHAKITMEKNSTLKLVEALNKELESLKNHIEQTTVQLNQEKKSLEIIQVNLKKIQELGLVHKDENPEYCKILQELKIALNSAQSLAYSTQEHQRDAALLEQTEKLLAEISLLDTEIGQQEQRKQSISVHCSTLKKLKTEKVILTQQIDQYGQLQKNMHEHELKKKDLAQRHQELNKTKETLLQEKGCIENQLQRFEQLKKDIIKIKHDITVLNESIEEYMAIANATSKNGIQALLIEEAIPEIEQEANNLLSRLTNNQAHIMIESLRDLKKGGTRETLDINISDNAGIRPYEMFSGGEAFRIDFALRIAISKLLARRAGTTLQTLIIDEGFGSQDEEGLSHIMDALYKIQEDFSRVIIVSHLSSMKESFPVHFYVHKGPYGSKVSVIEQG